MIYTNTVAELINKQCKKALVFVTNEKKTALWKKNIIAVYLYYIKYHNVILRHTEVILGWLWIMNVVKL
jgi:hypothetical protein